ncbi:MAG TPA: T9SS type A sorting domain-containing protein [Bacteroidia bacterium]|jgi:hypothetical protein|nr:T9SS type A sorting domain-containing protein [Bacteroidia bacterium]
MKKTKLCTFIIILAGFISSQKTDAQRNDTIRVMVYNVLGFGNPNNNNCQAPTQASMPPLYAELKSIVQFANADIIGLDKMQCVQTSISDVNGISSVYFPDTVISESMDAAYPGRYSFCPFTDLSRCVGGSSELVFYDHNKLVYVSTTPMYYGQEDFDMFKFYYNQPYFNSPDTTYLYVILCHTISSSTSTSGRDNEDSTVIKNLKTMFTHTPNLIYMGDFNTRTSTEPGYELLTQTSDTNFILNDPPFHPDAHFSYPDDWHSGNADQAYFTTCTRSTTLPNSCGVTGGAKDWYDHILLSPWIVKGIDNITYLKNSYRTIGNNGNRAGLDVNDSTTSGKNTSAPSSVLNALFNFSDKYPVEVTLTVNPILAVRNIETDQGSIKVNNPVENNLVMHFDPYLNGQNITMEILDVCGRSLFRSSLLINNTLISRNISLVPGVYFIHFSTGGYSTTLKVVKE